MIEHLYIKNAALIEEVSIDFNKGLNVLSGETGAGKSIITDSIAFVFGERQSRDFIRRGEKAAAVDVLVCVENEKTKEDIEKMGIEIGEDNSILISRTITSGGKNICRINGKNITVKMLKDIASMIINIHSQHEHQSLLNQSKHINILDKFCDEKLQPFREKLAEKLKKLREIKYKISSYSANESDRLYNLDLYKFQIDEISSAKLCEGEEEEIHKKAEELESAEKISKLAGASIEFLYGSGELSASERITGALNNISDICKADAAIKPIYEKLEKISIALDDVIIDLKNYAQNIPVDKFELLNIRERLSLIASLKRKYGANINEVLSFLEKTKKKYDFLINSEQITAELKKEENLISKEVLALCSQMTKIRKETALKIKENVEKSLHELGMEDAAFEIRIESKQSVSINGNNIVEFMICANKGEEMKSLSKTASGGEMSRIMLSLKSVLLEAESAETFIFDEIDTGVSGRTAHQVAIKLAELSVKRQIMCVTHLPQIAAMADGHYLIEKKEKQDRTVTTITELKDEGITRELSRLTGGAEIKESTLNASKDMKRLADEIKKKINERNKN